MHIRKQFENQTTETLLLTRDEAIKARDDLRAFYDLRYVKANGPTTPNPKSLPSMVGLPYRTELIYNRMRHFGRVAEEQIGELDFFIDALTEEIIGRSTK
jgi:hypothetical protein